MKLPYAKSYRELEVYRKAMNLALKIFELTKLFPKEESYSLTSQIRRSSRSIGAQIAEAWAKRNYVKHFASKLTDADGEQLETQHWIDISYQSGYLSKDNVDNLIKLCNDIGRLLGGMIIKADLFCQDRPHAIREDDSIYFITSISNEQSSDSN